jgi:hypothetical protein
MKIKPFGPQGRTCVFARISTSCKTAPCVTSMIYIISYLELRLKKRLIMSENPLTP